MNFLSTLSLIIAYCFTEIKTIKAYPLGSEKIEAVLIKPNKSRNHVTDLIMTNKVENLIGPTTSPAPGVTTIQGSADHVHFYLYTADNISSAHKIILGDNENLERSNFRVGSPLKILIHGFLSGYDHPFPTFLKNAYLKTSPNFNVILVDWEVLAQGPFYEKAASNTGVVGLQTSKLITFLLSNNATSLEMIHLIGHSLGAHGAGITGFNQQILKKRIPRISGLDPAKPLFQFSSLESRLDKSDADFVDVIHTSLLGFYTTVGHLDFYPNNGMVQKGCFPTDLGCNHAKAYEYFTESVYDPLHFKSCKCYAPQPLDIPMILPSTCKCNETDDTSIAYMGDAASQNDHGVFYLKTNDESLKFIKY